MNSVTSWAMGDMIAYLAGKDNKALPFRKIFEFVLRLYRYSI